jgi:hypothetical protein
MEWAGNPIMKDGILEFCPQGFRGCGGVSDGGGKLTADLNIAGKKGLVISGLS